MLHTSVTTPTYFYRIEPLSENLAIQTESLSWEHLAIQGGWVPAVNDIIYEHNFISLDIFRTTLSERDSLSDGLYKVQGHIIA